MRVAHGYNLVISNITANSATDTSRAISLLCNSTRFLVLISLLVVGSIGTLHAAEWSAPERELSRKIIALTGNAAISISFENRSSLGRRDAEIIQNGLRGSLAAMGARFAQNDPAAVAVTISLSENVTSYVWVGQIQKAGSDAAVVMVQTPRMPHSSSGSEPVPLTLRRVLLWSQPEPILDVAVLEENARLAVLSPEKVSVYRLRGGSSQLEGEAQISHSAAWPRDLRGRLVPGKDHLVDVYMPGVSCRSSANGPLSQNCQEGDDPWPLLPANAGSGSNLVSTGRAFFERSRNFFTGIETSPGGWLKIVPQFYSAALVLHDGNALWLFASVDGQIHIVAGAAADRVTNLKWGSDLTSIRTSCGAGWQVLATSPAEDAPDSVRAYEIPERDPVAVSAAVDFSGSISAMWTESKGDSAVVVQRNPETGNYEAFRVAVACGQ